MSCYTGFFNVRRRWQSLNTGPRFYLRLIRKTGWLLIYTSRTTDGCPFKPKKLSVPFLYPGVPAGLAPFRRLVPLGRRNLVPILPPAHPLGGGLSRMSSLSGRMNIARVNIECFTGCKRIKQRRISFVLGYLRMILWKISTAIGIKHRILATFNIKKNQFCQPVCR
jgi:hypothetical protein